MLCPYCRREISENARFCSKCGHKISRCPTCGRVLTSRLKYCTEDGTKLPDELLVDLPEAELMHTGGHPDQPQRRPNAPEPGFCIQCGAPCIGGQVRCARCQAKQQQDNSYQNKKKRRNQPQSRKKKLNIPVVLLVVLLTLLLAAGTVFAISQVTGVDLFGALAQFLWDVDEEKNIDDRTEADTDGQDQDLTGGQADEKGEDQEESSEETEEVDSGTLYENYLTDEMIPAKKIQSGYIKYAYSSDDAVTVSQGSDGIISAWQNDFDGDGQDEMLVVSSEPANSGYLNYSLDLYEIQDNAVTLAGTMTTVHALSDTGTTSVVSFGPYLCIGSHRAGRDNSTSISIFDLSGKSFDVVALYWYDRALNHVQIFNAASATALCDMDEKAYWDTGAYETAHNQIVSELSGRIENPDCVSFVADYLIYSIWGRDVLASCSPELIVESTFVGTTVSGIVSVNDYTGFLAENDFSAEITCGDSFPVGTVEYNGHHYCVTLDKTDWESAEQACEALGGHLVTVADADENEFVYELAQAYSTELAFLIGATDSAAEGEFVWVTGEPFLYTNWGYLNEPDNYRGYKEQDYVTILTFDQSGLYKDDSGEEWGVHASEWDDKDGGNNPYICEWDY